LIDSNLTTEVQVRINFKFKTKMLAMTTLLIMSHTQKDLLALSQVTTMTTSDCKYN